MIKHSYVITDASGREYRYDRYAQSTSIADAMRAEDSAIKAFITAFEVNPTSVREVAA